MADHAQVPQYRARAAPRRICRRLAGELHPLNRPRRRARAIDSSRFCPPAAIVLSRIGSKARVVAALPTKAGTDMKFLLLAGTACGLCSAPPDGNSGGEGRRESKRVDVGVVGFQKKKTKTRQTK